MRRCTWLRSTVFMASCLAFLANCSAGSDEAHGRAGGPGAGGGGGSGIGLGNGGSGNGSGVHIGNDPTPGCGDGVLTEDEACDDSNLEDGDGCAASCRAVELGWSCATPGAACIRIARCGDGFAVFPELCDDKNVEAGDGCSPTCKVEVGFKCDGSPSSCTPTTCGDDTQEGAESCEDGNIMPFDGCSTKCQAEPDCSAGACVSTCGDGLVLDEECDDGNNIDGDGCSADCKEEPGYDCAVPQPSGSMEVPAVFRDFKAAHSDFEPNGPAHFTPTFGMVAPELNADKKPTYVAVATSLVASAQSFGEWYNDVPGTNSTTISSITLWDGGDGRFVNRRGRMGEQWVLLTGESDHYCGNVGHEINAEPCTSTTEATASCGDIHGADFERCDTRGGVYWARYRKAAYDGDPAFFPVDADMFTPQAERTVAKISPPYGNWELDALHNFHFTSEIRYWFQYSAGQKYVLDFTGDDDVWVFINERLAVDLGGIHSANNGHLVIDETGAGTTSYTPTEGTAVLPTQTVDLGLEDGKVYQIAVFHAERQTVVSTFRLTLQGFATARSECTPVCGDGIVSLGEQCDDGVNDGGYGECGPNCVLGEFCGDGMVQGSEQCDDGNNVDGDACGSGCRNIVIR